MPVVNVPLPEVEQLIDRPVVMAVIEQLKQITLIPQSTEITYIGQDNQRTNFPHITDPGKAPVKLASDAAIFIDIDEEPDEGFFATTAGNQEEHWPDVFDRDLGVVFKPIYCGVNYNATVKFRTSSRSEAIRWRNDARYKASQMRLTNLHEVAYQYQIPDAAMVIAKHVYDLREKSAPSGETFDEFLSRRLTTRAIKATTVVGTLPELMIKEIQNRVQGTFDFSANPQKQDRNEGDGWEVTFQYIFSFHKPVEYSIRYPVIVHQNPFDYKYLPKLPAAPEEQAKRMPLSVAAMYYMEAPNTNARLTGDRPMQFVPEQDEWVPNVQPPSQLLAASYLLSLKPAPRQLLLNLNQMDNYVIDEDVLKWMLGAEARFLTAPGISPVGVHLYRNESLAHFQSIEVLPNGEVWLLEPLEVSKRYRLAIALSTDITKTHPDSLKRLARYPEAMCKILRMTKTTSGKLNSMLSYLDLGEFYHCTINAGMSREEGIGSIITRKTVMFAHTEAWRIEDMNNRGKK